MSSSKTSPRFRLCYIILAIVALFWMNLAISLHCRSHIDEVAFDDRSKIMKLRDSITFQPLKDLRFSNTATDGHTWFMSSLEDIEEQGESQYLKLPSNASNGKLLCLKGQDISDGSWNSYALAWSGILPPNAIFMKGLTFVSNSEYQFNNIWHGQSALMPFVRIYIKNKCRLPDRWVLYYKGELRNTIIPWVKSLMEATFDGHFALEDFNHNGSDVPICFKEAVVMRHNEGRLSIANRRQVYDLMRCKARMHCNVTTNPKAKPKIGMTLLLRDGSRSFKDPSLVTNIFQKACQKVNNCRFAVAYPHNLTFCEQVELMYGTDILISTHGAQVTNMLLMDRNSSVMELFPKGWLENAGIGQYVYHWLADWSGMRHQGVWRDDVAEDCRNSTDIDGCVRVSFMERQVGHNESYFMEWARRVLDVMQRSITNERESASSPVGGGLCGCESIHY